MFLYADRSEGKSNEAPANRDSDVDGESSTTCFVVLDPPLSLVVSFAPVPVRLSETCGDMLSADRVVMIAEVDVNDVGDSALLKDSVMAYVAAGNKGIAKSQGTDMGRVIAVVAGIDARYAESDAAASVKFAAE